MTFQFPHRNLRLIGRLISSSTIRPCKLYCIPRSKQQSSFAGSLSMDTVHTSNRLAELRSLMKANKVDVYGNVADPFEGLRAK